MLQDKEYALKVFGIERGTAKPRKDISKWAEIKNAMGDLDIPINVIE